MLLITPAEVIRHAFAPRERISPSSIRPIKIDIAQEHFIRPRFGDELFERLTEGAYPDFTERYIAPALAHFVRYGILAELCVEVGDHGALVYSASTDRTETAQTQESTENQTQQRTTASTDSTSADNLSTTHNTTNTNGTEGVHATTTVVGSTGAVQDDRKDVDLYSSRIADGTDRRQVDQERTSNQTASGTTAQTTEAATDTRRSGQAERYRPATASEIRSLSVRALSDAQILLAKAVRYADRRADELAEYTPRTLAQNVFF